MDIELLTTFSFNFCSGLLFVFWKLSVCITSLCGFISSASFILYCPSEVNITSRAPTSFINWRNSWDVDYSWTPLVIPYVSLELYTLCICSNNRFYKDATMYLSFIAEPPNKRLMIVDLVLAMGICIYVYLSVICAFTSVFQCTYWAEFLHDMTAVYIYLQYLLHEASAYMYI